MDTNNNNNDTENDTNNDTNNNDTTTTTTNDKKEETTKTFKVAEKDAWSDENVAFVCKNWKLTDTQSETLLQFKDRLQDITYWKNQPHEAVRFLYAHSFDLEKSESFFRGMVEWRIENDIDSVLDEYNPPEDMPQYLPGGILKGLDKEGDPIVISRKGSTDALGIVETFGKEAMVQHSIWLRENLLHGPWTKDYEREQKRPFVRIMAIEDLQGLSYRTVAPKVLNLYRDVMTKDQKHYGDMVKKIVIIRAPALFTMGWAVVKQVMRQNILDRVEICGDNYMEELDKYVDRELLPSCIYEHGKGEARPTKFRQTPSFEAAVFPQDTKDKSTSFLGLF